MDLLTFQNNPSASVEITAVDDLFIALVNSGRLQELKSLLSEDFVYVNTLGTISNRDEFVSLMRSRVPTAVLHQSRARTVKVFAGAFAVVHGVVEMTFQTPNQATTGLSAYSRVWVKSGDQWIAVSLHASDARLMDSWEKLLSARRPPLTSGFTV